MVLLKYTVYRSIWDWSALSVDERQGSSALPDWSLHPNIREPVK